jgi:hypothetical protein
VIFIFILPLNHKKYTNAKQRINDMSPIPYLYGFAIMVRAQYRIADLARKRLSGKRKATKAALKKLDNYFGDHSKFQFKAFQENGLPTGSGSIESAIRRVINLRVKGAGMFWKRKNAENIIFLRSLVLTGKLKNACRKTCSIVRKMFNNNLLEDLPMVA